MSHTRALLMGALAALLFASAASAQSTHPENVCEGGATPKSLGKEALAGRGLIGPYDTFLGGVQATVPRVPSLRVYVIATDCPREERDISLAWQTYKTGQDVNSPAHTTEYLTVYNLYVSAAFLGGWEDS